MIFRQRTFTSPPLSLQPLVENAVHHGILHRREGGTVTIRTAETDGYAVVAIVDDGIGMENARHSYKIQGGVYGSWHRECTKPYTDCGERQYGNTK